MVPTVELVSREIIFSFKKAYVKADSFMISLTAHPATISVFLIALQTFTSQFSRLMLETLKTIGPEITEIRT